MLFQATVISLAQAAELPRAPAPIYDWEVNNGGHVLAHTVADSGHEAVYFWNGSAWRRVADHPSGYTAFTLGPAGPVKVRVDDDDGVHFGGHTRTIAGGIYQILADDHVYVNDEHHLWSIPEGAPLDGARVTGGAKLSGGVVISGERDGTYRHRVEVSAPGQVEIRASDVPVAAAYRDGLFILRADETDVWVQAWPSPPESKAPLADGFIDMAADGATVAIVDQRWKVSWRRASDMETLGSAQLAVAGSYEGSVSGRFSDDGRLWAVQVDDRRIQMLDVPKGERPKRREPLLDMGRLADGPLPPQRMERYEAERTCVFGSDSMWNLKYTDAVLAPWGGIAAAHRALGTVLLAEEMPTENRIRWKAKDLDRTVDALIGGGEAGLWAALSPKDRRVLTDNPVQQISADGDLVVAANRTGWSLWSQLERVRSGQGAQISVAAGRLAIGGRVETAIDGQVLLDEDLEACAVALCPDGTHLAVATPFGTVVFDVDRAEPTWRLPKVDYGCSPRFIDDTKLVMHGLVWDIEARKPLGRWHTNSDPPPVCVPW